MNQKFPRSLIPRELRTTDAECSHKRHCWGVVREVLGYLDLQANRDTTGERFVWCSVGDIVEHCRRYKGAAYGKRAVEYSLAFLTRKSVVSRRLERKRGGVMREGYIVTPHDALYLRTKNICEFVRRRKPGYVWRRDPATRSWYWVQKAECGPGGLFL